MKKNNMKVRAKFEGDLAKPIQLDPYPAIHFAHPETLEAKEFKQAQLRRVSAEQWRKIPLLADHYGVLGRTGLNEFTLSLLIIQMATDLGVPGFQWGFDSPTGGRPRKISGEMRALAIEIVKKFGDARIDADAAREVAITEAETFDKKKLDPKRDRQEIASRARTIANSVSAARAAKKRKKNGKVH